MYDRLTRISQLSVSHKDDKDFRFTSLAHMIDMDMLISCYTAMDKDKAVGIDGVTKEQYGEHLLDNLKDLHDRLKSQKYTPKPARRVYIEKDNGKLRPLNIYCFEDKIVQEAIKRILEAIWEPLFYDEMMGFRPNRGCIDALRLLNVYIEKNYTNYILDADVKGFFDHLDHEYILTFIGGKIVDPSFLRLVRIMLKAGIMEGFEFDPTEEGSGQGAICSPIIANIYMHYVLIWWLKERVRASSEISKGFIGIVVYADDFVICFQHKKDAEIVHEHLKKRFGIFGLSLEEEKTRLIEFGRFAEQNSKRRGERHAATFTFLGFTHYCSKSRAGRFRVKRNTSKKKFRKKCIEMHQKIKNMRRMKIPDIIKKLNEILRGYYQYYGITDNFRCIRNFYYFVQKELYYWLNRRSQRRSYNWKTFSEMLKQHPLMRPRIMVSIYGNTVEQLTL